MVVHGDRVRPQERAQAELESAELAKAVILEAIENGWPDSAELEKIAVGTAIGNDSSLGSTVFGVVAEHVGV